MQIISRKDALAAGLGKYFTGKPCSHNHLAERYTASGTCSQCVIASTLSKRPAVSEARALRRAEKAADDEARISAFMQQRREYDQAAAELVEIKLRAYPADLATVKELAVVMGQTHYPMLGADRFGQIGKPTDLAGGTALYRFRIAAQDIELIRETAAALLNAHRVDVTSVRDAVIRQAEAMADTAATPAPEDWSK